MEKFEIKKVLRSKIKFADYNPRFISDGAKKRLKKGLKKFGLAQPLTWNKRTGNLVSGHQRLSILDEMNNYPKNDYEITIAVIDLSLKDEKTLNVQMNNGSMQGNFDFDALIELAQSDDIDLIDMGFSESDMDILSGDNSSLSFINESEEVKKDKNILDDIKKDRAEMVENQRLQNSANYYFVVICEDEDEKIELYNAMGISITEEYISSEQLINGMSKLIN